MLQLVCNVAYPSKPSVTKKSKEKLLKYVSECDYERESTQYKKAGLERKRVQYGRLEKLEEAVMK